MKPTITYAQYNEDIILAALLSEVKEGFYVDVGANQEENDSVTKYFYKRGWRGINIEPISRLINDFEKKRKKDINLAVAVAEKSGTLTLREYPERDGHSTLSEKRKNENDKENLSYIEYEVEIKSLESIFDEYQVENIDFLKIDVEGFEQEVLKSNNWEKYRPTIVCIEANHRFDKWDKYIEDKDYNLVIFDGLNEYYIANESMQLFENFAERATKKSYNSIKHHLMRSWEIDKKHILELQEILERQDKLIKSTQRALTTTNEELNRIQVFSLKGKPLKSRLKTVFYGLTTDWAKYIKSRRNNR